MLKTVISIDTTKPITQIDKKSKVRLNHSRKWEKLKSNKNTNEVLSIIPLTILSCGGRERGK